MFQKMSSEMDEVIQDNPEVGESEVQLKPKTVSQVQDDEYVEPQHDQDEPPVPRPRAAKAKSRNSNISQTLQFFRFLYVK